MDTICHIISACPIFAKEQHIKRHYRLCVQLHFIKCEEIGVKLENDHWYECVPKSLERSREGVVSILWNQQVKTDRNIPNNKPDIIIHDNENRICTLIDAANSGDRNMVKKEVEKILTMKTLQYKHSACGM
jgi:hypothetical protein